MIPLSEPFTDDMGRGRQSMPRKRKGRFRRDQRGNATEGLTDVYGTDDQSSTLTNRRSFLHGAAAALGIGALVTGSTAAQTILLGDTDEVSVATGDEGAVATSQPIATEVGAQILESGGNAIDAAVAIQTVLSVVEPQSTGLGGGGFMLSHIADDEKTYCLNSQVRAPAAATPDRFTGTNDDLTTSGLAVGVPGTVRGLDLALKRWGTYDLGVLLGPAISLAETGHPVDSRLANAIDDNQDRLSPDAAAVFCEGGDPLEEDDLLIREGLASTLSLLQEEGIDPFYNGEIAADIASTVEQNGGDLTTDDLASYNASVEPPLVGEYGGYRITTMGPPSAGGLAMLSTLSIGAGFDLGEFDRESAERYQRVLEASRLALADVIAYAGDTEFVDVPLQGLFDEDYLELRRAAVDLEEAASDIEPGNPWEFQPGEPYSVGPRTTEIQEGTTHFVVADDEGNVVSYSSTISSPFGTGIIVPERGILLANSLTNFDAEPGGPNEVQSGKRPLSSMTPTIVFDSESAPFAIGSPGGSAIPSVVTQTLLGVLEDEQGLEDAISRPRAFSSVSGTVTWEEGVPDGELAEFGYDVLDEPAVLGSIQSIISEDDSYVGAADSRRNGSAIGIPREE